MHRLAQTERELIERELVAREQAKAKARRFRRKVFWIGLFFGCGEAVMFRLFGSPIGGFACQACWLASIVVYTSGHAFLPATFTQDVDLGWQLNPWQETLRSLGEGASILEAVLLLASPKLFSVLLLFLVA